MMSREERTRRMGSDAERGVVASGRSGLRLKAHKAVHLGWGGYCTPLVVGAVSKEVVSGALLSKTRFTHEEHPGESLG